MAEKSEMVWTCEKGKGRPERGGEGERVRWFGHVKRAKGDLREVGKVRVGRQQLVGRPGK